MAATLIQATKQTGLASTANTTQYWGAGGRINFSSTESQVHLTMREAGTLNNLYCRLSANSIASNSTFRVRKNSANGNLSTSIIASTTGFFDDDTNSDSIAAADEICYQTVPGAASGTMTFTIQGMDYSATNDTVTRCVELGSTTFATASTTWFFPLMGELGLNTTESQSRTTIKRACTIKSLFANVTSNARTQTTTVRIRKNGANGSGTFSIGSTATGLFEDTTNSDSFAIADDANYSLTTGTGTQNLVIMMIACSLISTSAQGSYALCQASRSTGASHNANQTTYCPVGGTVDGAQTDETFVRREVYRKFDYSDMTFRISTNSLTAASTGWFRVAGANATNTVSIGSGATGTFADSTHTDTAEVGERVNISLVIGATGTSINIRQVNIWAVEVTGNDVTRSLATETITVGGGTLARLAAKMRPLATQTVTASESIARIRGRNPTLATQTVTIGETLARLAAKIRTRNETIIIGETRARLAAKNRALAAQTTVIAENVARVKGKIKTLATETVTVTGGTLARLAAKIRTRSETVTISENRTRVKGSMRSVAMQTVAIADSVARQVTEGAQQIERALATQTVAIGESLVRLKASNRALATQTITVTGGTLSRLKAALRPLTTQTVAISENLARLGIKMRALATQTVTIGSGTSVRIKGANRALVLQTVSVGESLARLKASLRTISQTVTKGESIARSRGAVRTISQTVIVAGGTMTRQMAQVRAISQSVILSEELNRVIAGANDVVKTITQTVTVTGGTLTRLTAKIRTASDTTTITGPVARIKGVNRTLSDTKTIGGGTAVRIKGKVKLISQTVTIGETLSRRLTQIRTISQSISITAPVARVKSANRLLSDSKSVSDSLLKVKGTIKNITQSTIINETLQRFLSQTRAISQSITITDNVVRAINIVRQDIERILSDGITILETLQVYVVKVSERFRRVTQPSQRKIISNHPAWLLGSRGMHEDYQEFDTR